MFGRLGHGVLIFNSVWLFSLFWTLQAIRGRPALLQTAGTCELGVVAADGSTTMFTVKSR